MIIVTCLKTATFFYHRIYLISPMASSNRLTLPIFFTPLTVPIFYSPTLGTKKYNVMVLMYLESTNLGVSSNNMTGTSSSKPSSSERVGEPSLDLGALHKPLSISPGWSREFGRSVYSVSKLSIMLSRVPLYLLGIAIISDFPPASLIVCLSILFWKIVTIWFWRGRRVSAQVFPRQAYAPMKQTFSIDSIVYQPFANEYLFFEPMAQTKLCFFPAPDSNYPNAPLDLRL